jgi:hypothetical protein
MPRPPHTSDAHAQEICGPQACRPTSSNCNLPCLPQLQTPLLQTSLKRAGQDLSEDRSGCLISFIVLSTTFTAPGVLPTQYCPVPLPGHTREEVSSGGREVYITGLLSPPPWHGAWRSAILVNGFQSANSSDEDYGGMLLAQAHAMAHECKLIGRALPNSAIALPRSTIRRWPHCNANARSNTSAVSDASG